MDSKILISIFLLLPSLVPAGSGSKRVTAVRVDNAPRIDGVLNESEWSLTRPATGFLQYLPLEGQPGTQPTEVRIMYDSEALYVGVTMFDADPSAIVARLARRDDQVESDWFSVRFDSYHDHQTAFEFTVNAAGVKIDILIANDGREEDASWDVVWESEVQITPEGWTAELRIPFKVLRFSDAESQEWGVQFIRYISRLYEVQHWVLIGKSESGFVSKFGHLEGLSGLPGPSRIELLPYAVGSNRFAPRSLSVPSGREFTSNLGMDAKIRPSSSLTIDATFNPDFGQVEADPAVLNLSTLETFYPEKRPFFIEGSQILRFTTFGGEFGPGLFYSRRVGKAINVEAPPGSYYEEPPRTATILGAAKISGKSDGLSIGVLEAVTAEETATLVDSAGNKSVRVVEPLTNYSLIRLRKDVLENSNAGMIVTAVHRKGGIPAMTAGTDWSLKFDNSTYRVDGFLAGSRSTGRAGERLDGAAGKLGVNKDGGVHWRWNLGVDFTSKKFNINDIGFFRRPNDYGGSGELLYRDDEVTSWKRIYNVGLSFHRRYNFDGAELYNSYALRGYVMLPSFWEIEAQGSVDQGKYDDRETRGYGLFRRAVNRELELAIESDPRQDIVGEVSVGLGEDSRSATSFRTGLDLELKLASSVTMNLALAHKRQARLLAWVANIPGPSSVTTVFGERTTSEWNFTTRGSFVFARDLTLQLYLQLFFAKGRYENFAEMVTSDTFAPLSTFSWPEFNRLVLNSNVVLRWEYLPGSTLFLVWSQARDGNHG
ncbi:MAG: carbohydrate binding family 9 domain-containing protein [Ignavibacteriales bacterium]|nr:carbohydrate binding family 9 domain-containing protein [Ignavibacteriales bacterium]